MPGIRNIIGVILVTGIAMAVINRIAPLRKLVQTDPR